MSYADGLLSTGERIIHRAKQHPFVFVVGRPLDDPRGDHRDPSCSGSAAASDRTASPGLAPVAPRMGRPSILFVGGIAVFAWTVLRYINQEYVLTNRRVIQVEGVLNRSGDRQLAREDQRRRPEPVGLRADVRLRRPDVLTAAESRIERIRMLARPDRFKKAMLDAKHEYEVDMERAGWAPSPPIREGDRGNGSDPGRIGRAHRSGRVAGRRTGGRRRRGAGRSRRPGRDHADAGEPGRPARPRRDHPRGVRAQEGGPARPALTPGPRPAPRSGYDTRDP